MYKKFVQAITWNSINIFLYKVILLSHQITLFHFVPKALYGTAGSIFSMIYLLVGITGFGFDYMLYSFFSNYKQTKKHFIELVPQYIVRCCTIAFIAISLCLLFYSNSHNCYIQFFTNHIPSALFPYLLLIFISESLKKSLETLAQLSFLNKQVAKIQVSMVAIYALLVWCLYFITQQITLTTIFIPMIIISYAELFLTSFILYQFYQRIPAKTSTPLPNIYKTAIMKEQSYNYINQVAKTLFSPNFLFVFIAYNLGMSQAGSIRFFTNIITLLYMVFNRSVGVPTGALFSNIAQESFSKTRQLFLKITNFYIQVLYILAISITAILIPHLQNKTILPHVFLFIAIGFIEYITLTYEKLFIVRKASNILACINISSLILLWICLHVSILYINPQLILLPILCIRICSTLCIGYVTYKKWSIFPQLRITGQTCMLSTIIALLIMYFL